MKHIMTISDEDYAIIDAFAKEAMIDDDELLHEIIKFYKQCRDSVDEMLEDRFSLEFKED